jgi:hypothetical protein
LDAVRQKEFRQQINELLEERAAEPGFNEPARWRWLVDHLEEYVSRWRAFGDLPIASKTPLTNLPGFDVVAAGIEVTSDVFENQGAPDRLLSAWTAVRAAMDSAVAHGGRSAAAQLHDRVIELQTLLKSEEE